MSTLRRFFWEHPEWWCIALCAVAWIAMFAHGWEYAGHGIRHRMSFAGELTNWMWMVAAMMIPFTIYLIRISAGRSLWRRRHRAVAEFLMGFGAPWLAVGIFAALLRQTSWSRSYAIPAVVFVAAALWQLTPVYRREFSKRHRTLPLAPLGLRADWDCLRFGAFAGRASVFTCGPIMLACALTGHNLIAMAGGMAIGALEHWSFRPRWKTSFATMLALSAACFVLALPFDLPH